MLRRVTGLLCHDNTHGNLLSSKRQIDVIWSTVYSNFLKSSFLLFASCFVFKKCVGFLLYFRPVSDDGFI
jgi:hypothetical protein